MLSSLDQPFPGSSDSPNRHKGSVPHLYWQHSALSCCSMQITILNQSGNHANQYPVYNYWNHYSIPWSKAFSYGYVESYWRVSRWNPKSLAPWSWYQQSYLGVTWATVDYMKKVCVHLRIVKRNRSHWSNELGAVSLSVWSKDVE